MNNRKEMFFVLTLFCNCSAVLYCVCVLGRLEFLLVGLLSFQSLAALKAAIKSIAWLLGHCVNETCTYTNIEYIEYIEYIDKDLDNQLLTSLFQLLECHPCVYMIRLGVLLYYSDLLFFFHVKSCNPRWPSIAMGRKSQ